MKTAKYKMVSMACSVLVLIGMSAGPMAAEIDTAQTGVTLGTDRGGIDGTDRGGQPGSGVDQTRGTDRGGQPEAAAHQTRATDRGGVTWWQALLDAMANGN